MTVAIKSAPIKNMRQSLITVTREEKAFRARWDFSGALKV